LWAIIWRSLASPTAIREYGIFIIRLKFIIARVSSRLHVAY
jgi:hypothetical protein